MSFRTGLSLVEVKWAELREVKGDAMIGEEITVIVACSSASSFPPILDWNCDLLKMSSRLLRKL